MSLVKQVVLAPVQPFNGNQLSESVAIYRQDGTQIAPGTLGGNQSAMYPRLYLCHSPAGSANKLLHLHGTPSGIAVVPADGELFVIAFVNGNTADDVTFKFALDHTEEPWLPYTGEESSANTLNNMYSRIADPDIPEISSVVCISYSDTLIAISQVNAIAP